MTIFAAKPNDSGTRRVMIDVYRAAFFAAFGNRVGFVGHIDTDSLALIVTAIGHVDGEEFTLTRGVSVEGIWRACADGRLTAFIACDVANFHQHWLNTVAGYQPATATGSHEFSQVVADMKP